jgi:hypothetical protein
VALRDSEVASATVGVNIAETKLIVFMVSAFMSGIAGAFIGMYYQHVDTSPFQALLGLTLVLGLVIGGVAYMSGALYAGLFLLGLTLLQQIWDISLLRAIEYLGPGLAALGIIASPNGAVVPLGQALARLLPWRTDPRAQPAAEGAVIPDPDPGDLGLTRPFTDADVARLDRTLGISAEVARAGVT